MKSEVIELLKIMLNRSWSSEYTLPGEIRVSLDRSPRELPNYKVKFQIIQQKQHNTEMFVIFLKTKKYVKVKKKS